jgi:hypothetical protein
MKKLIAIGLTITLLITFGVVWYNRVDVNASNTVISVTVNRNPQDIPVATTYGWINGVPVVSEELNYAWVNGKPYGVMTAATTAAPPAFIPKIWFWW